MSLKLLVPRLSDSADRYNVLSGQQRQIAAVGETKRPPIKLRRAETPDQDRAKADDCLRQARAARTREERLLYLGLAAIWLQVALVKDGATDIRLPSAPHL
jgi:hypothetical protein